MSERETTEVSEKDAAVRDETGGGGDGTLSQELLAEESELLSGIWISTTYTLSAPEIQQHMLLSL